MQLPADDGFMGGADDVDGRAVSEATTDPFVGGFSLEKGCRWLGAHAADQIQMNNEEGAEFFSRWGNILYMQRSGGLFGI